MEFGLEGVKQWLRKELAPADAGDQSGEHEHIASVLCGKQLHQPVHGVAHEHEQIAKNSEEERCCLTSLCQ